jgi:hypothetical protein
MKAARRSNERVYYCTISLVYDWVTAWMRRLEAQEKATLNARIMFSPLSTPLLSIIAIVKEIWSKPEEPSYSWHVLMSLAVTTQVRRKRQGE